MKIEAKKTNSVSENAIESSYFVLELPKLIYLWSIETFLKRDHCLWRVFVSRPFLFFFVLFTVEVLFPPPGIK